MLNPDTDHLGSKWTATLTLYPSSSKTPENAFPIRGAPPVTMEIMVAIIAQVCGILS